jgi:hypothetical protein
MPRIYFHLLQRNGLIEDPEGAEFEDMPSARREAQKAALELIVNFLEADRADNVVALQLTSADGESLEVISLTSVLPQGLLASANDSL